MQGCELHVCHLASFQKLVNCWLLLCVLTHEHAHANSDSGKYKVWSKCLCACARRVSMYYEWQAKLNMCEGALWDIGIVFRSSLYYIALQCLGHVLMSEINALLNIYCILYILNRNCLCLWLPVHIVGSCLMQATCGRLAVDITAHTKTWGKRLGDRVLLCLYRVNKGIARGMAFGMP